MRNTQAWWLLWTDYMPKQDENNNDDAVYWSSSPSVSTMSDDMKKFIKILFIVFEIVFVYVLFFILDDFQLSIILFGFIQIFLLGFYMFLFPINSLLWIVHSEVDNEKVALTKEDMPFDENKMYIGMHTQFILSSLIFTAIWASSIAIYYGQTWLSTPSWSILKVCLLVSFIAGIVALSTLKKIYDIKLPIQPEKTRKWFLIYAIFMISLVILAFLLRDKQYFNNYIIGFEFFVLSIFVLYLRILWTRKDRRRYW